MVCTYFNVVITGYNFPCDGSCIKCLCAQLLCAKNEFGKRHEDFHYYIPQHLIHHI